MNISPPERTSVVDGAGLVSIDTVLSRPRTRLSGLRWYDDNRLAAEITTREGAETHTISLDGTLTASPLRGAQSLDGTARLSKGPAGWTLSDDAAGESTILVLPQDGREYSSSSTPTWSLDGRFVAFVEIDRGVRRTSVAHEQRAGVSIVDVAAHSARGAIASRVIVVERNRPEAPRVVLLDGIVSHLRWGPDTTLYAARIAFDDPRPYTEILSLRSDASPQRVYQTAGRFQSLAPTVSPDGRHFAISLNVDTRSWDDFESIVLIDIESGEERRLTRDLPVLGSSLIWSRDGQATYALVRAGGLAQVWRIPIVGAPTQLTSAARRHFDLRLSPDGGRLAYQTEDGYGRRDVRVLDLARGIENVVLVIDDPSKELLLGEWRHIRWQSTDGVRPYGYLFLPPGFDRGHRYPMLVDVHGGGPGSWLYLTAPFTIAIAPGPLEWHAWASLGYVVFVPDYRSTGDYGSEVISSRLERGEYATLGDVEDIVSGVRHMTEQGYVDPRRVAILGHSAGGPRAYNAVVQNPALFAAAIISEGAPPDPTSSAIQNLSGRFMGERGLDVLANIHGIRLSNAQHRYRTNTMFDAVNSSTPMLIMMGSEDHGGTAHWPWEVVYSILAGSDVPARMLVFADEGHNHTSEASARLAFREAQMWLQQQMRDSSPPH